MRERHVSELIEEVFRRAAVKRGVRRAGAVIAWRAVAGAELAAFSTAVALRDGVLYVNVNDSETAMHLSLGRHRLVDAYRAYLGNADVRDIRFQVGRLDDGDERPASNRALIAPDPAALAALTASLQRLDLPEELERATLAAGTRFLGLQAARRELGWTTCPTCGALHDGPLRPESLREAARKAAGRRDADAELERALCQACYRYAHEGRVVAAAERLRTAPRAEVDGLGEDERAVAAYLAARSLDSVIATLLPAAVTDDRLALQLESVVRCRLALEHGREPETFTPADFHAFDPHVANVLRLAGGRG
ncbi:MAG: DUF721 domain-containing protein [Trueperaceae bacterium]|nr:DUF721 domain-containing protein [Trueperaceae bacterium]MCC6310923.1 DUF721 domain-containing protein [Trueperaceae bacterium]MCO5174014.1 DUF721 domain-containing protein [Trueperaceae bacterium]MCW5820097.1 DUF721 domain-containing protein [Trueperaceae bacterium]